MRAAAPPASPSSSSGRRAAAEGVDQPVACDGSDPLASLADLVGEARCLEEVERRVRPAPGLEVEPGRLEQGSRQRDDGVSTRRGGHLVEELAEERVVAGADAGERLDGGEDQLRVVPELPVRGEHRPGVGEALVSLRRFAGFEQRCARGRGSRAGRSRRRVRPSATPPAGPAPVAPRPSTRPRPSRASLLPGRRRAARPAPPRQRAGRPRPRSACRRSSIRLWRYETSARRRSSAPAEPRRPAGAAPDRPVRRARRSGRRGRAVAPGARPRASARRRARTSPPPRHDRGGRSPRRPRPRAGRPPPRRAPRWPPPSARPGAPRTCRRPRSRPRAPDARRGARPPSPAGTPPTGRAGG